MIYRMIRASGNDLSIYGQLKFDPKYTSESLLVISIVAAIGGLIAVISEIVSSGTTYPLALFFAWVLSAVGFLVGYLILAIWAWFVGTKIAKGIGTFEQVRTALAYAYSPLLFSGLPWRWIGLLAGLWTLVTASSAIRVTLGIGKWGTFFIVLSGFVVVFVLRATVEGLLLWLLLILFG